MSTSKKQPAYHHGDLRNALVDAAVAMLEEGADPAALSLREAARRAGVSAMAPYRHFADRDALLAAVAAVGFARLGAALAEADKDEDPREALVRQGVAYVRFAVTNAPLFRLMFGRTLAVRHDDLLTKGKTAYDVLWDRVTSLVKPAEAEAWAMACWASAHGLAMLYVDGQLAETAVSPEIMADKVLRLLPVGA